MKGKFGLYVCAFFSIFPMYFTISSTLHSAGSWCPYQVEKVVPCRVRNGTEPYYGTNICWRNENGSYACTKKLMYRARYTTTYKKVRETKYRCCPGRDGPDCENECYNCTSFRKLEERISAHERRLGRLEKLVPVQKSPSSGGGGGGILDHRYLSRDFSSENSVYPAGSPHHHPPGTSEVTSSPISLAYATLNLRVQTILDEFREMQNRIHYLENEVARLSTQVDDLSLGTNIAYDYSGGTGSSSGGSGTGESSSLHGNKDMRINPAVVDPSRSVTGTSKDSPTSGQVEMTNDEGHSTTTPRTRTKEDEDRSRHDHESHHRRHPHNHHHHHHQPQNNVDLTPSPPPPSSHHPHVSHHHHHHHRHSSTSSGKSESGGSSSSSPFRVLEENLERGDIASTLNDDYGDELYNDNSTEQYIDQLHAKREQHSP